KSKQKRKSKKTFLYRISILGLNEPYFYCSSNCTRYKPRFAVLSPACSQPLGLDLIFIPTNREMHPTQTFVSSNPKMHSTQH
ncbi:hypothetical protein VIGAN_01440000, partial [Vigna angularis var. angularis]